MGFIERYDTTNVASTIEEKLEADGEKCTRSTVIHERAAEVDYRQGSWRKIPKPHLSRCLFAQSRIILCYPLRFSLSSVLGGWEIGFARSDYRVSFRSAVHEAIEEIEPQLQRTILGHREPFQGKSMFEGPVRKSRCTLALNSHLSENAKYCLVDYQNNLLSSLKTPVDSPQCTVAWDHPSRSHTSSSSYEKHPNAFH